MSKTRKGMSYAQIEKVVAQRVAIAIEAIAVYEIEIRMAHESMDKVNVTRAYTGGTDEKKAYAGNLLYYNKCKLHHVGLCTVKCGNYKRVGHMDRDCKAPIAAAIQGAPMANKKAVVICYECGKQRHYKSECPKLKNQTVRTKFGKEELAGTLISSRIRSMLKERPSRLA
nr:reverse transcriptase domain-containing protein [Tanacetum cinerariifolium]